MIDFLCRYLASDMEEDNQAPKQDIFYFLYGKSYAQRPMFHKLRFQFIRSMSWRIRVSQEECEEVWGMKGNVGCRERGMGLNVGCGIGEWKSWKVGPGNVGSSRRASIYSSNCFVCFRSRLTTQSSGYGHEIVLS